MSELHEPAAAAEPTLSYSRGQLLCLYTTTAPTVETAERVRSFGLWSVCRLRCSKYASIARLPLRRSDRDFYVGLYRRCRAGRSRRPDPSLRPAGNGAAIIGANRPRAGLPEPRSEASLLRVHIDRHSAPPGGDLRFGCLNVHSMANKLDDLLEVRRDQRLDVMFLVETWADSDSVCLRRMRVEGLQVIDRPRPRSRVDTLATNHGGVAVVAASGVRLTRLDLGTKPATFEQLCVRIVANRSSCIAVVIYRPGSVAVSASFFAELSDLLDKLATFVDPVYLVGDINIRSDRAADPVAGRLVDTLAAYGVTNWVTTATHDRGGSLDVVITRDDLPAPSVDVLDAGLSDHRLLCWHAPLARPCPEYVTSTGRPWQRLNQASFRAALVASPLCRPDSWSASGVDDLAQLYDNEVTAILNRSIPIRSARCKRRASQPWFDDDCRVAKRLTRTFEFRSLRADKLSAAATVSTSTGSEDVATATAAAAAAAAAAANSTWKTQLRAYRDLQRRRREAYWQGKLSADRTSPQQLWRSINELLGRGRIPTSSAISADDFHKFFDAKVVGVRASTDGAPPPSFTAAPPNCILRSFRTLTDADVVTAVRQLPDKQCMSDPMPTRLLKDNIDVLSPFLVSLFNRSMSLGVVPSVFKEAHITPLLKKPDMDPADVKSYRPISNLSVLSKLLERLVARQLLDYLTASKLLPELQSAYRACHSTETAVLKVLGDILRAVDSGDLACLTLLDLSAAFDTVDHETLLRRLKESYGLHGNVLSWFTSYLGRRTQFVRCGGSGSVPTPVLYGVPQGSVLGPILFLLYTADLLQLIMSHGLHPHLYADDTQVYGFCRPGATAPLQSRITTCIGDVDTWMRSNRLQLNTAKTEVMWCASSRRQSQLPTEPVQLGHDEVVPVRAVRDLGIYLDSDVTMKTHVTKTVASCFAALRQIRSIRRSVTRPVLLSLVVSLVLTRLDYGCTTLAGLPDCLLDRLQSVLNAAARLVNSARKFDHVTPLLRDLHWLRVPERISFRLSVLVFRGLHGLAPEYIASDLQRVADVAARRRLRSASTSALLVPSTHHCTIGDRAFPVAAARAWNSLPPHVTGAPSLPVFRSRLKTELFRRSYSEQ